MINKVILIGNVGADPTIRCFENGNQVANLCLITSERYKDKDGNKWEISELHNIEAWGKPADIIDQYVRKGDKLYIEGSIHYEGYNDKQNEKRYRTKIRLRKLKLLPPKQKQDEATPTQQPQVTQSATPEPPKVPMPPMPDVEDELPFL